MASTLTKLQAVNIVIRAVGEPPVFSTDSQNPYVLTALSLLAEKSRDIQSKGWWFNTQRSFRLLPDEQGYVSIPSNTLAINTDDPNSKYAVRDDHIIDLNNNTYKFGEPISLSIIEEVEFNNLPYAAAKAIAYNAAIEMQRSFEMDRNKLSSLAIDYREAEMELKKEHLRNSNHLGTRTPQAQRLLSSGLRGSGRGSRLLF